MVSPPPPLPCVPASQPSRRLHREAAGRRFEEKKIRMRYIKSLLSFEGTTGSHPDEDDLEEFVFGRLDGVELDRIEEHLLACEACRRQLTETENFVASTRATARKMLGAPAPTPRARRFSAPAWALAGAFAVVLLAISFSLVPRFRAPRSVDLLVAERGVTLATAPSQRPLPAPRCRRAQCPVARNCRCARPAPARRPHLRREWFGASSRTSPAPGPSLDSPLR